MKKPAHPGYLAIRKAALAYGLPTHFRRDLTFHDRRALRDVDPSEPFAWVLRERGTHLVFPRRWAKHNAYSDLRAVLSTLERDFPDVRHWWWWDGRELWHSSAQAVEDHCAAEFERARTHLSDLVEVEP